MPKKGFSKKGIKQVFPEMPVGAREIHINSAKKVCWMLYRTKFRYGAIRLQYPLDRLIVIELGYSFVRRQHSTSIFHKPPRAVAAETPLRVRGVNKEGARYRARVKDKYVGMFESAESARDALVAKVKQLRESGELKSA